MNLKIDKQLHDRYLFTQAGAKRAVLSPWDTLSDPVRISLFLDTLYLILNLREQRLEINKSCIYLKKINHVYI